MPQIGADRRLGPRPRPRPGVIRAGSSTAGLDCPGRLCFLPKPLLRARLAGTGARPGAGAGRRPGSPREPARPLEQRQRGVETGPHRLVAVAAHRDRGVAAAHHEARPTAAMAAAAPTVAHLAVVAARHVAPAAAPRPAPPLALIAVAALGIGIAVAIVGPG